MIVDELQPWIDAQRQARSVTSLVTEADVLGYNYATRQTASEYLRPDAARASGFRGLVAAPGYVTAIGLSAQYLQPMSELRDDGVPSNTVPPIRVRRVVAGEVEDHIWEPVCAGDLITVTERLAECTRKTGSGGSVLLLCTFDRHFSRDGGIEIARERYTRVLVLEDADK